MKRISRDKKEEEFLDKIANEATRKRTGKRVMLNDDDASFKFASGRQDTNSRQLPELNDLNRIEVQFVNYYTKHYLPGKAAVEAGYSATFAQKTAHELLKNPRIKRAIDRIELERLRSTQIDGDYILNRIIQIALANPAGASRLIVPPCRHCWGLNNGYQRTHAEFEEDFEAHVQSSRKNKPPFDEKGGSGYDIHLPPNEECPNCFGKGDKEHPRAVFTSTHLMPSDARALFAGARVKNGHTEVLLRDQGAAMGFLQRFAEKFLELRENDQGSRTIDLRPSGSSAPSRVSRIERIIIDPTQIEEVDD